MKIVVLGAGALGAYFGARWTEVGQDVTFLVREKRAKQIREHGIQLHSKQGEYKVSDPKVVEEVNDIQDADLVLLAVKGYHLDGTMDTLKSLVNKGAKVLPILNGIEHIPILQQELGKESVLGGLSFIISTLDDKGHVVHSSPFHDLVYGVLHPSQQSVVEELDRISENAKIGNKLSESISEELWNKYMFITAFSGITTASNLPIGEIRNYKETFDLVKNFLQEMKTLANGYEIPLTDEHVENALNKLKGLPDEATSSMHQDRRKGLTLEVDHLHGGALRLAEKIGLDLPYTRTTYGLIKPFENEMV
ncbi:ketopantoate reductase family protein [Aquibacillus sp. 3ASR75-11]|uniref:2-dehydropantoate 2-reductase n=1 Tax=Terrihalobacillus insolitus TaxID=2950438 RepID=A0A9X3WWX2_9BACI|nr:ketopantoate reductase family protein [Terrihalobacillus insolitus]MDC3413260.1 ketopantoate reductase family protein [Terrihalobacillus insolitus]MDC3425686.1 ketopantoate reductase family protein [Terrihalobacillus insolitus]